MKLTQKQMSDFLASLGLEGVEVVDNEEESTFSPDEALSVIDNSRKPIIKQVLHNDIHKELAGVINRALRKDLSALTGIDAAEIDGIESKDALKKALDFYKESTKGEVNQSQKEWQSKIDDILAKHSEEKTKLTSEWENKYNQLNENLTRNGVIAALAKAHREAKGLPEKADREELAKLFYNEHNGKTAIMKLNEYGDLKLYDPKNPEMELLNDNKTKHVGVNDLIKPYYSRLGMYNEDTREVNAAAAAAKAPSNIAAAASGNNGVRVEGNNNAERMANYAKMLSQ